MTVQAVSILRVRLMRYYARSPLRPPVVALSGSLASALRSAPSILIPAAFQHPRPDLIGPRRAAHPLVISIHEVASVCLAVARAAIPPAPFLGIAGSFGADRATRGPCRLLREVLVCTAFLLIPHPMVSARLSVAISFRCVVLGPAVLSARRRITACAQVEGVRGSQRCARRLCTHKLILVAHRAAPGPPISVGLVLVTHILSDRRLIRTNPALVVAIRRQAPCTRCVANARALVALLLGRPRSISAILGACCLGMKLPRLVDAAFPPRQVERLTRCLLPDSSPIRRLEVVVRMNAAYAATPPIFVLPAPHMR
mmetsp:Transcript_38571/g.96628  ORF Transcript_38571/g.96628 Transcript_38571/m.96628 type:complete len:313 (-) Transcript_38571:2231-3169(-)